VVDVVADDEGDDLTDHERRALRDALSSSWQSAEAGRQHPASATLDELRQRREPAGPDHTRRRRTDPQNRRLLRMVATGKNADFLVPDANPLDNIANTRWISR
jgi:hypothetical protein